MAINLKKLRMEIKLEKKSKFPDFARIEHINEFLLSRKKKL